MTAPYRTSEASLRAEVERLTRELATLRERRARRWTVRSPGYGALVGSVGALVGSVGGFALAVANGHALASAAVALAACGAVWALAFVRRVPVDGGGE